LLVNFNWPAGFLFGFYADEFNAMVDRITKCEDLLHVDRRHIYPLLENEKAIPHWKASLGYGVFQTFVGLSVLGVKPPGLFAVVLVSAVWLLGFFVFSSFLRRSVARPA
jgi:hypothetical protein